MLLEAIAQEIDSDGTTKGVVPGGVERGIAGQEVALEVDAGVFERSLQAGDRLGMPKSGEEVCVGNHIVRIAGQETVFHEKQQAVGCSLFAGAILPRVDDHSQ